MTLENEEEQEHFTMRRLSLVQGQEEAREVVQLQVR